MSNSPTLLRRSQLGELLVAEGKLTREELAAALAYREERGLKLGQALVALHLVTQQDLAGALRSQGRVHCLNLTPSVVDPEVARLLPEAMARQYVAVPVHRVAGRVTVAMEDPAEEYDVDAIAVALGEPVFAVHADPERIADAIERVHRTGAQSARSEADAPRFTLVRGPLPESEPDEAAENLVRAALCEALAIGADSFHVESTARGAEMSFRVDGARTPAALLPAEWAEACVRCLVALVGATPGAEHAAGTVQLGEQALELDVATIVGSHGTCARAALRAPASPVAIEHLPLDVEERATVRSWAAATGLVLVVGPARAGCDSLASELAERAATSGRRVYRLGSAGAPAEGIVAVSRRHGADTASDLRAIGDQAPDVVDAGPVAGGPAWRAALDLARSGTLVIARVEARDGASALATVLRAVEDGAAVAGACTGSVALREVRLTCPGCRSHAGEGQPARDCPQCGGSGFQGSARIAEVLDLRGPLREHVERDAGADGLRAAAVALGIATLDERGRDLVRRGATNEREVQRALNR